MLQELIGGKQNAEEQLVTCLQVNLSSKLLASLCPHLSCKAQAVVQTASHKLPMR